MAEFNKFAPILHKWEKGFANDPDDSGGATMDGVTLAVFRKYYGKHKTVADLKRMTPVQWAYIMTDGYWDKMKADLIDNQSIANICADWLVNSGEGKIKNIQSIVGVAADGIVGQKTISAINSADQLVLFGKIKAAREKFYRDIVTRKPSQKKFLNGWLNRLNDYKYSEI